MSVRFGVQRSREDDIWHDLQCPTNFASPVHLEQVSQDTVLSTVAVDQQLDQDSHTRHFGSLPGVDLKAQSKTGNLKYGKRAD